MEEALIAHLLAFGGLTDIVGQRITPALRPQGSALPALVVTKISDLPDYTMQGPSGLASSRIQIDAWASTYAGAKTAARQVEERLSGMDASIGDGGSPEKFTILRGGFMQNESDSFERGQGGVDLYRVSQDYIIWSGQG